MSLEHTKSVQRSVSLFSKRRIPPNNEKKKYILISVHHRPSHSYSPFLFLCFHLCSSPSKASVQHIPFLWTSFPFPRPRHLEVQPDLRTLLRASSHLCNSASLAMPIRGEKGTPGIVTWAQGIVTEKLQNW